MPALRRRQQKAPAVAEVAVVVCHLSVWEEPTKLAGNEYEEPLSTQIVLAATENAEEA